MNLVINPGSRCLLDGKTEVVVLKPATRSYSTYNIEIPGKSIETVKRHRLKLINAVVEPVDADLVK
ncbi:MAG: hypothetical protein DI539_17850 [Flavobacterium psychrophilum]|jgi:hypothetical protein|nr:MAG: hypothetical protein DI539_17850 [Flavobacterium psychrophilum]